MAQNISLWSTVAASNTSVDGVAIGEGVPYANMNDMGRAIIGCVRAELMASGVSTITAATIATVSGIGMFQYMSGNTTIDGFDTAVTGMMRDVRVLGTPMLRNSAALALPDSIDRRLIPGDIIRARSLGAGSWVVKIDPQQAQEASATITAASVMDITVAKPFAQVSGATTIDTFTTAVTGMYRELQLLSTPLLKNSSALALQGSTNYQGAAGDMLRARSLGAGNWVVTADPKIGAAPVIRSHISGLALSNNGSDAANDIDISAGSCLDGTNADTLLLASALTKRLDATWAVGTNQGGLDTGAEAISTHYYLWVIKRVDTGVVDVLFSASATAPTMPANYTLKRLIGAIYNDASSAITAFHQRNNGRLRTFMYDTPIVDVDAANPGTSAVTRTLTVPALGVEARVNLGAYNAAATFVAVYLSALDQVDLAPQPIGTASISSPGATLINTGASANWAFAQAAVYANTSSQIRSRCSASLAASRIGIVTLGWNYEF